MEKRPGAKMFQKYNVCFTSIDDVDVPIEMETKQIKQDLNAIFSIQMYHSKEPRGLRIFEHLLLQNCVSIICKWWKLPPSGVGNKPKRSFYAVRQHVSFYIIWGDAGTSCHGCGKKAVKIGACNFADYITMFRSSVYVCNC